MPVVWCGSTLRETASHCHNVVRACKISSIQCRWCRATCEYRLGAIKKDGQERVFVETCMLACMFDTLPELPSSNSNHVEHPGLQHMVAHRMKIRADFAH